MPHLRRLTIFLSVLFLLLTPHVSSLGRKVTVVSSTAEARTWEAGGSDQTAWKGVDEFVSKQQYQAALDETTKLLEAAAKKQDVANWTRGLIRKALLEQGLHAYETSVKNFREAKWPKDPQAESLLQLFYGQTLLNYYWAYSYEIRQREKIVSTKELDLKKWDQETLFAEINRSYLKVFQDREALGILQVSDFPEFITRHGYPEGIRSSFRDFVTYQWITFFSNTATWSPRESQETYLLNLNDLLQPKGSSGSIDLIADSSHPLEKISYLLNDLYAWHRSAKRSEAVLETQLERVRILKQTFTQAEEQKVIREQLAGFLKDFRRLPWWAQGQYELAALFQSAGDMVRAHALTEEGAKAFPESIGSRNCFALQKAIEVPDFNLQSMALDRAYGRSFLVEHKNLRRLYFRAYKVDFFQAFEEKGWEALNTYSTFMRDIVHKSKPLKSWSVDLAATPDYKMHKTYVSPALEENAYYVIAASPTEDFRTENNRITAFQFLTSPFVLVSRSLPDGSGEIFVRQGNDGNPVSKAAIDFYRIDEKSHARRVKNYVADEQGYLKIPTRSWGNLNYLFCVAHKNGVFTFDPQAFSFYGYGRNRATSGVFVYTDRSIYRPLQKMMVKVVAYSGNAEKGEFQASSQQTLRVVIQDPNSQEVSHLDLVTNSFGSASGEFMIPAGRLLGRYHVIAANGSTQIRVEEYKRPTFEAELQPPKTNLRLNQTAKIDGQAKYYFGLPLSSGTVKYRVFRQVQFPFWYCWRYFWFANQAVDRQITAGKTVLKEDGSFLIEFKPEGDAALPDKKSVHYLYRVEADVTDEGGETRSSTKTYPIGFVSVQAQIDFADQFFTARQAGTAKVMRTDLSGVPKEGKGEFRLLALQQDEKISWPNSEEITLPKDEFHLPGDSKPPRWQYYSGKAAALFRLRDGAEMTHGVLQHQKDGWAEVKFPALTPGAYRLRYETKDPFGETYTTQKEFVVAAPTAALKLPLYLYAKNSSVRVGEQAELYFGGGDPGQPYFIELSKDQKVFRREFRRNAKDTQMLTLPITENLRGGFSVQVFSMRDYQAFSDQTTVYVPWDNKELKLAFSSFRDRLRPGQEETWSVQVKGPKNEAVAAELLAYMYDKSLDYFTPHLYPTAQSLYAHDYGLQGFRANLNMIYGVPLFSSNWYDIPSGVYIGPDTLLFYANYAIGGVGMRGYGGGRYMLRSAMSAPATAALETEGAMNEDNGAARDRLERRDAKVGKKNKEEADKPAEKRPEKSNQGDEQPLRSNFSETAFFKPQLVTNKEGVAEIRFKVPDSVTAWNVYVHALTRDFKYMTLLKEVQTAKDLQVRPYLPRFLREGDEAVVKVVVDNTTTKAIEGELLLDILDPDKRTSQIKDFKIDKKSAPFSVAPKQSSSVSFSLKAPSKLGTYAFRIEAKSKEFSDGELRPLPILPGRVHLIQSKFAVLKNDQKKVLEIKDLAQAASDPSLIHDSFVVSLEGQLIYSVLKALPYLTNYPYECLEQTLNRFLSTAIVTSLYGQYPTVKAVAQGFAKRQTQLDPWAAQDPNRKMALEETPWLQDAKGGSSDHLINVLDERVARQNRDSALEKIKKAQLANGAWPWFAGGPPSPYITLYLLHGFAKAAEFQVDLPKDTVRKAWAYMAQQYRDYYKGKFVIDDYCYSYITFLNYVLSAYPDASYYAGSFSPEERREMLDYSFKYWKKHNPYGKALLALTLQRMQRPNDAQEVLASIMDSAKSSEDEGTHWAAEDRSWLWYNDTIESQAFILRTLMEIAPKNPKTDGVVLWLFLNKKMNQWKSTRATAEVIYSLVSYLKATNALGVREEAQVAFAGQSHRYVFEPSTYAGGQTHIVLNGDQVKPEMAKVTVDKKGKGYMFASTTWHYSTEKMPEEERGDFLSVKREYFLRLNEGGRYVLKPLKEGASVKVGDQVEVQLSIRSKHAAEYVHLRDPRAAGFEPENQVSAHHWELGIVWYEEIRDSGTNFFFEGLPQGEYTFKYRLRANLAGKFKAGPATLQSMYAPEFAAFSSGANLEIIP